MSASPQARAGPVLRIASSKGGPEGSRATIARTSAGLASARSQPNGPACEWVTEDRRPDPVEERGAGRLDEPLGVRVARQVLDLARVEGVEDRVAPAAAPLAGAGPLRVGLGRGQVPRLSVAVKVLSRAGAMKARSGPSRPGW